MFLSAYRLPNDIPISLGLLQVRLRDLQQSAGGADLSELSDRATLAYRFKSGDVVVFRENLELIEDGTYSGPEVEADPALIVSRTAEVLRKQVDETFHLRPGDWEFRVPNADSLAADLLRSLGRGS